MDGGVDVFGRATTSRRGRLRGTSFGTDGPPERDRSFTGSRFPKTNPCFLPYRPSPRSFLTSHTSAVDARSRCCPGSKPELTKPYARCKARRTIPPQSSRAGRERVGSSTTGPLTHRREDTEGAATERSSRFSCTRTRFWSAPTATSSSYSPRASRTSTPSGDSPNRSDAAPAGPRARPRGQKVATAEVATAAADTTEVHVRCIPPRAADAGVPQRFRSSRLMGSRSTAAIASGARAATDLAAGQSNAASGGGSTVPGGEATAFL